MTVAAGAEYMQQQAYSSYRLVGVKVLQDHCHELERCVRMLVLVYKPEYIWLTLLPCQLGSWFWDSGLHRT